jgi:hypothetical protein
LTGLAKLLDEAASADSGTGALVSWERHSEPNCGDTSRAVLAAWLGPSPAGPAPREVLLPYRAYASAEVSRAGPTRSRGLALFAYGLAGQPEFGLYPQAESAWRKVDPYRDEPLPAKQHAVVDVLVTEPFAVAGDAPVAAVAGFETPCESMYACDSYAAALEKGVDDSLAHFRRRSPASSPPATSARPQLRSTETRPSCVGGARESERSLSARGVVGISPLGSNRAHERVRSECRLRPRRAGRRLDGRRRRHGRGSARARTHLGNRHRPGSRAQRRPLARQRKCARSGGIGVRHERRRRLVPIFEKR